MAKNFILDTNVLLHDPRALFHFEENTVIIPIYVLEEVDQFKKELSERGRNARTVSRYLDELRAKKGRLSEGVELDNGGRLMVALAEHRIPQIFQDRHKTDNYILAVALEVAEKDPDRETIFVSKDVNLRVRADALGLKAEDYQADKIDIEELYQGCVTLQAPPERVEALRAEHSILPTDAELERLRPNEFVILEDRENPKNTVLARYDPWQGRIVTVADHPAEGIWGIRPRNKEQRFALDLLLDDRIKLVTLVGKAGTGKTLLALAAGLHKVVDKKAFVRLLVSRPIFPLGRDLGYLPGDVEEKLNPWMQPIYDNVELLVGSGTGPGGQSGRKGRPGGDGYKTLVDMGYMQIEPLTYIRGRSIPNQFMIVDEAQNLTPHEVKTIVTRVGDDTKIVLTGDPYQIDNPYVDASNNGLTYVVERVKGEKMSGHITLVKGERSPLAELAANLL